MLTFNAFKTALNAISLRLDALKKSFDWIADGLSSITDRLSSTEAAIPAPDWDENDPKSKNYVKNKPCYDYVEPNAVIWESNSAGESAQGALELISDMGDNSVIEGETYTLTVNGVQTTHICQTNDDKLEITGSGIFQLTWPDGVTSLKAWTTWQQGSSVKLEGPFRQYKKLDTKFYNAVKSINGETGDVEITPVGLKVPQVGDVVTSSFIFRRAIFGELSDGTTANRLYLGGGNMITGETNAGTNIPVIVFGANRKCILRSVENPVDDYDATNKSYVDKAVSAERNYILLNSSTEDSTKRFEITVDDSGTISAKEITS